MVTKVTNNPSMQTVFVGLADRLAVGYALLNPNKRSTEWKVTYAARVVLSWIATLFVGPVHYWHKQRIVKQVLEKAECREIKDLLQKTPNLKEFVANLVQNDLCFILGNKPNEEQLILQLLDYPEFATAMANTLISNRAALTVHFYYNPSATFASGVLAKLSESEKPEFIKAIVLSLSGNYLLHVMSNSSGRKFVAGLLESSIFVNALYAALVNPAAMPNFSQSMTSTLKITDLEIARKDFLELFLAKLTIAQKETFEHTNKSLMTPIV